MVIYEQDIELRDGLILHLSVTGPDRMDPSRDEDYDDNAFYGADI